MKATRAIGAAFVGMILAAAIWAAIGAIIILGLAVFVAAHAATCSGSNIAPVGGLTVVCSKTFNIAGVCGKPNFPGPAWADVPWRTGAWEPVPISIVGVSLNLTMQTGSAWGLLRGTVGNSYTPDLILPVKSEWGAGSLTLENKIMFPAGMGMPFSGPFNGDPAGNQHLDTHVNCLPEGNAFDGYVIFYYTD